MSRLVFAFLLGFLGMGLTPQTAIAADDWVVVKDATDNGVRTVFITKASLEPPLVTLGPIVFVYPGVRPDLATYDFNESLALSLNREGFTAIPGAHVGGKIAREHDLGGSTLNTKVMFFGTFEDFKPMAAEMAEKNGQVLNWAGVAETLVSGVALAAGALLNNQYLGVAGMTMANQQSQFGSFKKDDIDWFKAAPDLEPTGSQAPVKVIVVKSLISRLDRSSFFERAYLDPVFMTVFVYKEISYEKLLGIAADRLAEQVRALAPPIPPLSDKQNEWLSSHR